MFLWPFGGKKFFEKVKKSCPAAENSAGIF